ncbi:MAG: TetR/AcrR family transcriptional regulator [Actinomycetota bacterium]|nr:TetR/AcrR family transcriptional regulator [Actinomycetota bacterium]
MSATTVSRLDEVGTTLLRAAAGLLAQQGPGALTVRGIATAAGMSTMNVYSRFGGKDGVVEQLFLQGFTLLGDAMQAAGTSDDPLADLQRCGQAYRRFATEHDTLYAVMFEGVVADFEPSEQALAEAMGTLDQLAKRLERAMDLGLLRRIPPMHAAAIVWSTVHGVVSLELKHQHDTLVDWQQVFDDATAAVLKGLAA